ncbi:MAG: hypothetical protein AAF937_11665 [Planctomycetota bacterium]
MNATDAVAYAIDAPVVLLANVAAPGLSVAGLFPLWVLVPIVAVERGVYRWRHRGRWLTRVVLANVVSALAGAPVAAILVMSTNRDHLISSVAMVMGGMYAASVVIEHGVLALLSRSAAGDRPRWSTAWLASVTTYASLTAILVILLI